MTALTPFGERSLTVVAAGFPDREAAETAASALLRDAPALQGEVTIIRPGDPMADRKLEPENRGIWRTMIRSHILFGLAGALVGFVAAVIAITVPWAAAALSPLYTSLFMVVFGAFFGMIFAGLLTLRPDHAYVVEKVHEFSEQGLWSVVARPLNAVCSKAAYESLRHTGTGAVRSF
jgi:hypothetical protein